MGLSAAAAFRTLLTLLWAILSHGAIQESDWQALLKLDYQEGDPCNPEWSGVTCNANKTRITKLEYHSRGLDKPIPAELGELSELEVLDLSNNLLSGPLPAALGSLTNLVKLDLSNNLLTGPIPPELSLLASVIFMDLSSNALNGSIPPDLGSMPQISQLLLSNNALTGTIPPELLLPTDLTSLYLHSNQLSGPIPAVFNGVLQWLLLSNNNLSGPIPVGLWDLPFLGISLSFNNLTGELPDAFGSLSFVYPRGIDLSFNRLEGSIPPTLTELTNLQRLNLSSNLLTGRIPTRLSPNLTLLGLAANALEGPIPSTLYDLKLERLELGSNKLSGALTGQFSTSLVALDLHSNALSGSIPPSIFELPGLLSLNLSDNLLTGPIPSPIGDLVLTDLDLHANSLTGEIPPSLWYITTLTTLDLSINNLTGVLPPLLPVSSSLVELNLFANNLSGPIPGQLLQLSQLRNLRLSENRLTGSIPPPQGSLSLADLDLHSNALTGEIPQSLWNITTLRSVNLAYNYLNGSVAATSSSAALQRNLSYNCFSDGDAPQRAYLDCLPYGGNLVGSQPPPSLLRSQAPPAPFSIGQTSSKTIVIAVSVVASIALAVIIACFVIWRRCFVASRAPPPQPLPKSLTIENTPVEKWKLSDVQAATNGFDDTCIIGRGGFATVYRAVLGDKIMAIKRLSERGMHLEGEGDFIKEVKTIGSIHNRNLLALQGYCIEENECLLIYKFMANGSLQDFLFAKDSVNHLSWPQCMKVLLGTANAIAYLHEGCAEKIIHRDIKPANILLDENFTPYVADFGLVRSATIEDTHVSTKVAGTRGYLAPEYAMSGRLSEKSDVYSFGVVILVVISNRQAIHKSGTEHTVGIMELAYKLAAEDRLLDLVAPHLLTNYDIEQARRLISIALLCTQMSWQDRPTMGYVVQMLNGNIGVPSVDLGAIEHFNNARVNIPALSPWSISQASSQRSDHNSSGATSRSGSNKQDHF